MSCAHLNALVGSKLLDLHLGCSFFCSCCCSPAFFSGQQWLQMISRWFKKINDKKTLFFMKCCFKNLNLVSFLAAMIVHIFENHFFWNRPLKLCVGRIFFFSHTILSFRVYIIFSKKNLSKNLFSHKFLRMWEDHGGKTHLRENFSLENDTQTRSFPSGGKLIKKLIPRDFKQLRRRLVYK